MISDTTPEMERMVLELRRAQTPGERISNAMQMSELVRSVEMGVLREQHPGASPEELCYFLTVKRYGRELARKAFGVKVTSA
jgi:hypothetical protein